MELMLKKGFTLRHPTNDDLRGVAELITACDLDEMGHSDVSEDELQMDWMRSGFDLEREAWVVVAPDGTIAGYEDLYNRKEHYRLDGDGYVHPDYKGMGIGTTMLRVLEIKAREHILLAPPEVRITLRNGVSGANRAACELHENEGYHPVRYYWRMEIQLDDAPPAPEWPADIQVRNVIPQKDTRPIFDFLQEAFKDHWNASPWDYETWHRRRFEGEKFDPKLWFVAEDGGAIAGCAINRYRQDTGWVSQLAVGSDWRQRGLGLALLRRSFAEFYQRGTTLVGLGVDAGNPTGATRLYKKAGMHVAHEYILYEKELRPGIDP